MTDLRRLFVTLTVTCGICMVPGQLHASRKATDLMSAALKSRAAGRLSEAISSFEYASEQADSAVQKNLARFMLGDCQLEAGRFADAASTFSALSETVNTPEEKAEALFRLMQAYSGLGNRNQARSVFAQIRRNHPRSPYYELAKSFMTTEGYKEVFVDEAQKKPATEKTVAPETAIKTTPKNVVKPVAPPKNEDPEISDSDTLPDEYMEAEPENTASLKPFAAKEPLPKQKNEPEPERSSREKSQVPARKTQSFQAGGGAVSGMKKAAPEVAALLREALHVEMATGKEKEELVSKILGLQDALKDGPEKAGMDHTLISLAEATASFGELLESCKTYDKVLTHHPASPLVEKAYFQAIRLRAILGVHEAVVGWSKAFLAAFPASEYRSQIRALVEYSQAGGKLDISVGKDATAANSAVNAPQGNIKNDIVAANAALAADSQYVAAAKKMKDGKYNLALVDFNRLAIKHPDAPQIWWDSALVQVQLEDFKKAAKAISRMLELDPGNEDANSLSGYIHYRLENFEEAASAYDQAGEPDGRGVNFFDARTASERMKKSAGKKQ